ncbi:MAG: hypothetical protein AB8H86_21560 [Polyangiales bacterium]
MSGAKREDIRFGDKHQFVELCLVLEAGDDYHVSTLVQTSGFRGAAETCVHRAQWQDFCQELSQLEKTRRGKASLESISPGELKLEVLNTSRAGAMAVTGLLGTDIDTRVRMTFDPIPFDPSSLPELVRIARSWALPIIPWKPPAATGEWRSLREDEKWSWLQSVRDAFFAQAKRSPTPRATGKTVILEGSLIEDVASFYCALGEAVNGPGGYFGTHTIALFDALHGGFGLDAPATIHWRDSGASRLVLDSAALVRELNRDIERAATSGLPHPSAAQLEQAESGARTMFDELVGLIQNASDGGFRLVLE